METSIQQIDAEQRAAIAARTAIESLDLVRGFEVHCDADKEFAAGLIRELKEAASEIDKMRRSFTDPLNELVKRWNAFFRPAREACEEGERVLKQRVADYMRERDRANAAAMTAAAAASTPAEAQLALAAVGSAAPPAGMSVRYVWKFEITDPDAVPRELCSPDPKKIGALVAGAEPPEVPGVRWFQEPIVTARRSS